MSKLTGIKKDSYKKYYGKSDEKTGTFHLLPWHCLDVAAVGTVLVQKDSRLFSIFNSHPLFQDNPGLLSFLLAVHDIGKYSCLFQEKIQKHIDNGAGHTAESFALLKHEIKSGILQQYFAQCIPDTKSLTIFTAHINILIESVAGHHGKPVTKETINQNSSLMNFGSENQKDATDFLTDLAEKFLPEIKVSESLITDKKRYKSQTTNLSWILAGLCVTSDWVASNEKYFIWDAELHSLDDYWSGSVLAAEAALNATGLIPSPASGLDTISELFGFSPRYLQKVVEELTVETGPNLYIIEESTGGGKTEAALVLAEKLLEAGCGDGFYFALPTMATSNAMYERIAGPSRLYEKFFSSSLPVSVVLSHGQKDLSKRFADYLSEYGAAFKDSWLFNSSKKALLSSIGVGTIDQVLMGVLPWKHQCLRLFGCAKNILIIDEVHAYDTYMNSLLENLLKFHKNCGGSAILLSATLPKTLKEKFVSIYSSEKYLPGDFLPYPLVTHVGSSGVVEEISVPPSPEKYVSVRLESDFDSVVSDIISAADKGGCVCYVCNTVADAERAFSVLKSKTSHPVHLFHARFVMKDRLNRENEVLDLFGKSSTTQGRAGQILVATQVVEQSLDLDFDFMVCDLAPVDLIIQRAGRLWRHERERPAGFACPKFVIHSPNPVLDAGEDWYSSMFSGGAFVYPEHGKLWKTAKILSDMGGFSMPRDARFLIDSVYSSDEAGVPDALQKVDFKEAQKMKVSGAHANRAALNIAEGYSYSQNAWTNEEPALTREGEGSILLEFYRSVLGREVIWSGFDTIQGHLMSQMSIRRSVILDKVLSEYDKSEYVEPLKVVFTFSDTEKIWKPENSIFKSNLVYYSEEDGLVLPK